MELARKLTRLLVRRWFGPRVETAPFVVDGLAGIVAARIEAGPTIEEADGWLQAELAAGRPVSVVWSGPAAGSGGPDLRVASSFVSFLLSSGGEAALRSFLAACDPDRRDAAALAAYQRPLATLEETWLARVSRPRRRRTVFRAFLGQVVRLLRPYWRRELEVGVCMLFEMVWGVALPLVTRTLIDDVIPKGDVRRLVLYLGLLLVLYVGDALVGLRRAYVNNLINTSVLLDLQKAMFGHLQRLSHGFYGRAKVGDLMTRLSGDLQVVEDALAHVAGVGVYMALRTVTAAVTLLVLSPRLGLLVLLVVPLFAFVYFFLRTRLNAASVELQNRLGDAAGTAQETLTAHAVVKAFGMERRVITAYANRLLAILKVTMRLVVVGGLFETSMGLATTLGELLVLGIGGYLVIQGGLTVGTLVAFMALLPSLFSPVAMLSNVGKTVESAAGALDRVTELMEEPVTIVDRPGALGLRPVEREIRLEGATLAYEPGRPILQDVALAIPAGSHVAIVGPSGSGKSSVINLLLRFWDPQAGRVLFDGLDARDVTIDSLRGQIGLVFQDSFVFDTTIRENVAMGREGASDADVIAAVAAAELDTYVAALPAGLDTVLGERGVRMSGGQRQRLAIARALVRAPRILILDEATSALDPETEGELLATFAKVARDRTTISVTHRLSMAAIADHVFVLDQGRLVEQGSHAELVKLGGLYTRLYEEQIGRAADLGAAGLAGRR